MAAGQMFFSKARCSTHLLSFRFEDAVSVDVTQGPDQIAISQRL